MMAIGVVLPESSATWPLPLEYRVEIEYLQFEIHINFQSVLNFQSLIKRLSRQRANNKNWNGQNIKKPRLQEIKASLAKLS